jgi:hypothetical protein
MSFKKIVPVKPAPKPKGKKAPKKAPRRPVSQ